MTPNFPLPGLDTVLSIATAQVWGLVENRRYLKSEPGGWRNLATRFIIGIVLGGWTRREAELTVRQGSQGLDTLRGLRGRELTYKQVLGRPLAADSCAHLAEKA